MSAKFKPTSIAVMAILAVALAWGADTRSLAADNVKPAGNCAEAAKPPAQSVVNIASAESAFGEALFAKLHSVSPGKTVLISPMSVSTALSLAGMGAEGSTRAEFESALELERFGLTLNGVAENQKDLRRALKPCGGTQFELANSIWTARGFELRAPFVKLQQSRFDAVIRAVDFGNPETLPTINGWVSKKTNGKIKTILDKLSSQTRLILINALHFKGKWQLPFDKNLTSPMNFTRADGSSVSVPAMHRFDKVSYLDTPSFQAVALPFADSRYEMIVVLPRKASEEAVAAALAGGWSSTLDLAKFHQAKVILAMPRMRLDWGGDLPKALQALGLNEAFGPHADFSGLTPEPVEIDQVIHKVVFEADEEGAEGAAATAVVMVATASLHPPKPFEMTVDRPYYVLVRENTTGTVLFMGFVADPGTRQ